jgi:hypothetical protein
MTLLLRGANTLIEYQQFFVLALAFVRKSLYRTRRFHSLWASAAHMTHANHANSHTNNCGIGRLRGEFCLASIAK